MSTILDFRRAFPYLSGTSHESMLASLPDELVSEMDLDDVRIETHRELNRYDICALRTKIRKRRVVLLILPEDDDVPRIESLFKVAALLKRWRPGSADDGPAGPITLVPVVFYRKSKKWSWPKGILSCCQSEPARRAAA